jgi:hypothetical protein
MTRGLNMAKILFISLIHLIQHPDVYDQKHVRVVGFASFEFEGTAVYVSQEAYDHTITKNAIWLDVGLPESVLKYHKKYVLVEGIFDRNRLGHKNMFSGTLWQINRLDLWESDEK